MTVLDWLAPPDRPFRKGVMLGFDARHSRGHLYRSILEAIALTMKQNVDAMCGDLGIVLDEIVVSGGGASSPLFMQHLRRCLRDPRAREASAPEARASVPRSALPRPPESIPTSRRQPSG